MKVSELLKDSKPPKILIFSEVGGGKTGLAFTLGARAQCLDYDDGLKTVASIKDKFTNDRLSVDVRQYLDPEPHKKAIAFKQAKEYIYGLSGEILRGQWPYDALIIDSFTTFAEAAVAYVMSNSGRIGQNPEIQHWGLAFTEIKNVIGVLRSLPITLVVLAHTQVKTVKRGETTEDKIEVAVPGKNMPTQISKFFDELWYLRAKPIGGGKFARVLQTVNDDLRVCRSRASLPDGTDTDVGMWGLIEKLGYKPPVREEKK